MLIYSNLQLIRALVNFHVCIIKVSNLFVASVFMVYIFSLQMKDNIFKDCNTPSPLRLGLSLFFFSNKIFAKIHKVYQST
jgi:hypothetical protein